MKLPYRKIIPEHSEDFRDGKTIVMNVGRLENKKYPEFNTKILLFEVQFETETDFVIVAGKDDVFEYPGGIKSLTSNEMKLCFERLFKKGITCDV